MIGGTDSRHYDGIAERHLQVLADACAHRGPEPLPRHQRAHSTANYVELIQFYHQLIGNAQPDA
jgi:hypothetical protein